MQPIDAEQLARDFTTLLVVMLGGDQAGHYADQARANGATPLEWAARALVALLVDNYDVPTTPPAGGD